MKAVYVTDNSRGAGFGIFKLTDFESELAEEVLFSKDIEFSIRRAGDGKTLHKNSWEDANYVLKPEQLNKQEEELLLFVGPEIINHLDELETYRFTLILPTGTKKNAVLELKNIVYSAVGSSGAVAAPKAQIINTNSKKTEEILPVEPVLPVLSEESPENTEQAEPPNVKEDESAVWLEQKKREKNQKIWLILIILILALLALGVAFYFYNKSKNEQNSVSQIETNAIQSQEQPTPIPEPVATPEPTPTPELTPEPTPELSPEPAPSPVIPDSKEKASEAVPLPKPKSSMDQAREYLRDNTEQKGGFSKAVELAKDVAGTDNQGADAAFLLLSDAADNGDVEAMLLVGEYFDPVSAKPKGSIETDMEVAMYWYHAALEQGSNEASDKITALKDWAKREAGAGSKKAAQILLDYGE